MEMIKAMDEYLTNESDFHFRFSDEDVEQRNSVNENDGVCNPIVLKELLTIFSTEEIFNLITDLTNIYEKRKRTK